MASIMNWTWMLLCLICVLAASCSNNGDNAGRGVRELRGYLFVGGELYAFQSCGSAHMIWFNVLNFQGSDKLKGAMQANPSLSTATTTTFTAYVEMTALVSGPGSYGGICKFDRQLDIMEIYRAEANGPEDCPQVPPDCSP